MADERRRADRVFVKLPVKMEEGEGVTRDITANGIYFQTDMQCEPGSEINFTITFEQYPGPMILRCKAVVVRVEHKDGKMGVAARVIESSYLPLDAANEGAGNP